VKATFREFNYESVPAKSGRYTTIYRRAKSRDLVQGTATFRKRASGGHERGWSEISGPRGDVFPSFDSRDYRIVSPVVVAWR